MPTKQKIKCIVDLGMTVLLLLLMAYTLVGEAAHEWLGMAMLVLFLLHHALNFKWLKTCRADAIPASAFCKPYWPRSFC